MKQSPALYKDCGEAAVMIERESKEGWYVHAMLSGTGRAGVRPDVRILVVYHKDED